VSTTEGVVTVEPTPVEVDVDVDVAPTLVTGKPPVGVVVPFVTPVVSVVTRLVGKLLVTSEDPVGRLVTVGVVKLPSEVSSSTVFCPEVTEDKPPTGGAVYTLYACSIAGVATPNVLR
jgi:hypothetical protein